MRAERAAIRLGAWSLTAFFPAFLVALAVAPRVLAAAPTWDYVYFPDTLPESAPAGAWGTDHDPGQDPTVAGGAVV